MTAPTSLIQDGRGRGAGDQRASWGDPRAQTLPGANALRAVRAGHFVRNLWRAVKFLQSPKNDCCFDRLSKALIHPGWDLHHEQGNRG